MKNKKPRWNCTDDEIIRGIERANGFLTIAAQNLGCTYQAIWNRQKRNKKIKEAIEAIRETHIDLSEHQLIKNIKAGDTTAIIFHLKCLGKKRGYVERQEITGKDGESINITFEMRLAEIARKRETETNNAFKRGEIVSENDHGNGRH